MYSKCENLNFHYHHFLYRDSVTRFWTFFVVKNLYSRLRLNFSIWRQQSRKFVFPKSSTLRTNNILSLQLVEKLTLFESSDFSQIFHGVFPLPHHCGKNRTNLSSIQGSLYTCSCPLVELKKNVQNVVHTVKNRCFLFLIFFEGCKI